MRTVWAVVVLVSIIKTYLYIQVRAEVSCWLLAAGTHSMFRGSCCQKFQFLLWKFFQDWDW